MNDVQLNLLGIRLQRLILVLSTTLVPEELGLDNN